MGHKQFKTTARSPDANGDNKLEKIRGTSALWNQRLADILPNGIVVFPCGWWLLSVAPYTKDATKVPNSGRRVGAKLNEHEYIDCWKGLFLQSFYQALLLQPLKWNMSWMLDASCLSCQATAKSKVSNACTNHSLVSRRPMMVALLIWAALKHKMLERQSRGLVMLGKPHVEWSTWFGMIGLGCARNSCI